MLSLHRPINRFFFKYPVKLLLQHSVFKKNLGMFHYFEDIKENVKLVKLSESFH